VGPATDLAARVDLVGEAAEHHGAMRRARHLLADRGATSAIRRETLVACDAIDASRVTPLPVRAS